MKNGISCLLINTDLRNSLFSECKDEFIVLKSSIDKVMKYNAQLNNLIEISDEYFTHINDFKNGGFKLIDDKFNQKLK